MTNEELYDRIKQKFEAMESIPLSYNNLMSAYEIGREDGCVERTSTTPGTMSTEMILFRLFSMPCCGHLLCWVNPRLPSYCPECGKSVMLELKFHADQHTLLHDDKALLKHRV